jgi:hypothetical protein
LLYGNLGKAGGTLKYSNDPMPPVSHEELHFVGTLADQGTEIARGPHAKLRLVELSVVNSVGLIADIGAAQHGRFRPD